MGLWQILKGEQPGLLKSVLHYRNAGQFGEYLIDYALQSNGIEGERVVLTNLYLPMKGKATEIDLLMLHEKGTFVIEQILQRLDIRQRRPVEMDAVLQKRSQGTLLQSRQAEPHAYQGIG